jgi:hypothetical protein
MISFANDFRRLDKWKILIIYLAVVFLLFSIGKVTTLVKNHSLIMDDSVYNLIRSAKDIDRYDELSHTYWSDYSHSYLKPFLILGDEYGVITAEAVLLIISILALFLLIKDEWVLMLLYISSPFFINNYFILSDFTIVVTLLLITVAIYNTGRKYYCLPFVGIISFMDPIAGFIIVLYLAYDYIINKTNAYYILANVIIWISCMVAGKHLIITRWILNPWDNLIFEFGAVKGLPILVIVIGLIGLYKYYKENRWILFCFIVGITTLGFEKGLGVILIGCSLIYYTFKIIELLILKKWELDSIKTISIYMVFCGIIFSYVSGINMMATHKFDNPQLLDGFDWIKTNTDRYDKVFISPKFIGKVEYRVGHGILPYTVNNVKGDEIDINDDYNKIIHSRNIDETKALLERNNVSIVIITPDIKVDFKLKSDSDGILFIVQSYNVFKEVYRNDFLTIYKYYGKND